MKIGVVADIQKPFKSYDDPLNLMSAYIASLGKTFAPGCPRLNYIGRQYLVPRRNFL